MGKLGPKASGKGSYKYGDRRKEREITTVSSGGPEADTTLEGIRKIFGMEIVESMYAPPDTVTMMEKKPFPPAYRPDLERKFAESLKEREELEALKEKLFPDFQVNTYILTPDKRVKPEPDTVRWAEWFENADRIVKKEKWTNGEETVEVSTVFLGVDHGFGPPANTGPVVFETMVFGGEHSDYMDRCSTWEGALKMHDRIAAMALGSIEPEPDDGLTDEQRKLLETIDDEDLETRRDVN